MHLDIVCWRGEKLLKQSQGWKQGVRGKPLKSLQEIGANMNINGHFLHKPSR